MYENIPTVSNPNWRNMQVSGSFNLQDFADDFVARLRLLFEQTDAEWSKFTDEEKAKIRLQLNELFGAFNIPLEAK